MKIVVGGYIVSFPLGGMTWHHLNYLLGLHELGHEVFFLEDGGQWILPYNPTTKEVGVDSSYGRAYLEKTFRDFGLPIRWCYHLEQEGQYFGATEQELNDVLRDADLLVCVSGVTAMRPNRPRPKRTLVIDTDPVFTQLRMTENEEFLNYYKQFDHVATFGRLIGTSDCPLPTHGFDWIPTNQPIAMNHWPVARGPRTSDNYTTIGKWEHGGRAVTFNGQSYLSSKAVEWMKMLDLPRQVPWRMTIGMQAMPADVRAEFESHGWHFTDAESASADCRTFSAFLRNSAGEFTVAKQIYSGVPSGWFSDRSACYLASGKPVVTQSTGFETWLPPGNGLASFTTTEEAASALRRIHDDYDIHATGARRLAEQFFDSRRVLTELVDRVM
ncbi:MAG: hypothetical protein H7Z14_18490 [Anaerolineae bacterium]|nr:hypothetical protein [Phycisphaerae bacterium]